jgi:hypothetical protein
MQVAYLVQHNQIVLAHTVTVCQVMISCHLLMEPQVGHLEVEADLVTMLDHRQAAADKFGQLQTKAAQKPAQLT